MASLLGNCRYSGLNRLPRRQCSPQYGLEAVRSARNRVLARRFRSRTLHDCPRHPQEGQDRPVDEGNGAFCTQ